ncbi:hypothetical protein U1Q18_007141 [Sarracenia purpurea var. burkii]
MVYKVEEAMKKRQEEQQQNQHKGKESSTQHHQLQKQMHCNKGKAGKFKKSSSNLEEDGVSSAILLLACIAFAPSTSQ